VTAPVMPAVPAPLRLRLERPDALLVGSVLVAGFAAAYAGHPWLWAATPVIAGMLAMVSRRVATPVSGDEYAAFPAKLRLVVTDTLARLPEGDARRSLQEVLRPARAVLADRDSEFDARSDAAVQEDVAELVEGACEMALDLSRIDEAAPAAASGAADLIARYQSARSLFERHLGEAALALAALYASGVEHGTPASERVSELVASLREEASVRSDAKAELNALLSGSGGDATRAG
jgi:hypothetical protein